MALLPFLRAAVVCGVLTLLLTPPRVSAAELKQQTDAVAQGVRVGAAAAELEADDSMIIAGGITAGKASGQEGKLRAVGVVLEKAPFGKFAIVACDILMITRQHLDPVVAEITKATGIPPANILINCTHTH